MHGIAYKSRIICSMENLINTGKKIIIYDCSDEGLLESLYADIKDRKMNEIEIWHNLKENNQYNSLRWITREEMDEIIDIYRLYDFSDKVMLINTTSQYGSLFNYINENLLTKDEVSEAILHKY